MGCLYPFGQAGDQRQNSDQTPAPTRRAPKLARSKKFCRGRERYDVFGPKGGTQRNQNLWIPNVQIYRCCATREFERSQRRQAGIRPPSFCAVFSHVRSGCFCFRTTSRRREEQMLTTLTNEDTTPSFRLLGLAEACSVPMVAIRPHSTS